MNKENCALKLVDEIILGTKLFHADGQTNRHVEKNSRFRKFAKAPLNR